MTKVAKRVGVGQILDKQDATKTYNEQNEGLIYNDQNLGIRTQIEGADREVLTDTQTQNVSNKTISLSTLVSPSINSPTVSDGTFSNSVINNATINSASINVPVLSGGTLSLTTLESSSVNSCTLSGSTIDVDNNTLTNVEVDNLKSGVLLTTVVSVSINDANLFSAKCIKDYVDLQDSGVSGNLTNHINDTVGAHAASAISNTPSGNLSATDQQAVNNELQSDIDTRELASNKGAANGYCPLGADQKVPAANLPSYVDDIEEYANLAAFPVTGESGKLYLALDTSLLYRWSGSVYAEVSQSLALGETSTTAYRGDRGKTAYDHSQTTSGSHGITGSFVGTTDTQALTNKDYQGGTASDTSRLTLPSNTLTNLNGLTRKEGTVVYATDTDKVYYDDGTNLTAVGSGSGSGSLATYSQLKSDDDTGTWSTGNNATFLGGGSIAGTFTKQNATNPLNGTYSYTLVQAAGSLNDYIASDVQAVPLRSRGVTNSTDLVYTYDGSDNDIKWVVYDVTNASVIAVTSYIKSSSLAKTAQLVYDLPLTCTQVRFGAQVVVANNGKTLKFDDVQLATWTPQAVNLTQEEAATYTGYTSKDGSNRVRFANRTLYRAGTIFEDNWSTVATDGYVKVTAKKNINVVLSTNGVSQSATYLGISVRVYNSSGTLINIGAEDTTTLAGYAGSPSVTMQMSAGDYALVMFNNNTGANDISTNFSITATAISDNVVQSWQDGTEWTSFTPTGSWTTNTTYTGKWKRDGSDLDCDILVTASGAPTSANLTVNLPSGLAIDTTKIVSSSSGYMSLGLGRLIDANGSTYPLYGVYNSATSVSVNYTDDAATGVVYNQVSQATPVTIASGDTVHIKFRVPIQGWSSTPTLLALPAATQTEYVLEVNSNAAQSVAISTAIPFANIVTNKNMNWNGTSTTIPLAGMYKISANVFTSNAAGWGLSVFVNGSLKKSSCQAPSNITSQSLSVEVYLNQGDVVDVRQNGTGVTMNLSNNDAYHWISITRINGKNDGVFVGNVQPEWQYDISSYVTGFSSVSRAVAVVYKMGGGQYRMKFNIFGAANAASRPSYTVAISGVIFKALLPFQSVSSIDNNPVPQVAGAYGNSSNIIVYHTAAVTSSYSFSGDVELESKPTWATMTN